MQITFNRDGGKIGFFAMQNGDHLSVSTDANRLVDMLPPDTMMALREAVAQLHDVLEATAPQSLKVVSGGQR